MNHCSLNIEVRDAAHWTALHHAAFEGKLHAVTILLQAGAEINCSDPYVSWSLNYYSEPLFILFCFQGVTPLHLATYRNHVEIVRHLLSKGANPKMTVRVPVTGKHPKSRYSEITSE